MSGKPTPSALPVFPEGNEPQWRRRPWWKRAWLFVATGWCGLIATVIDFLVLAFGSVWKWLEKYLRGRQLLRLLYGLPALATLVGAGVLAVLLVRASRYDVRPLYRARAKEARQAHNLELAKVCYLRVVHDDRSQPEDMFGLYQTLHELKQEDQADTLLIQLTPLDGSGYPPAHVALARRLLSHGFGAQAKRHLEKALELRPDFVDAHALLGQFYFAVRNWKLAEQHLVQAEPAEPLRAVPAEALRAWLLMLATEAQGNVEGCRLWARRAADNCRQVLKNDPKNVPARLDLAVILVKLQDHGAAMTLLRDGMEADPRPEYARALAQIYAWQVRALPKDKTTAEAAVRWNLIEKGLREDPDNLILLQQLLEVTHGTDSTADQARARLQQLLAQGQASAVLHLALGLDAYAHQKLDQARVHWDRAFDLDKRMVVAANNLAWLLAHQSVAAPNRASIVLACGVQTSQLPTRDDPENLKRALELSEYVLKQMPDQPNFRETRGQIHAQVARWKANAPDHEYALPGSIVKVFGSLSSWQASVSDLEYALPLVANKGPIHLSLARGYQELGLPDLAEQHRKLAQPVKP